MVGYRISFLTRPDNPLIVWDTSRSAKIEIEDPDIIKRETTLKQSTRQGLQDRSYTMEDIDYKSIFELL